MPKNSEGKELDAFEKEMEYRLTNLDKTTKRSIGDGLAFAVGQKSGFEYALAIYRECREAGTI